ncbi:MAG TPA: DUF4203 domain-containing protein [bacterium]|nr:DUF4203 domain-containing protein [bacterium]
MIDSVQFQALVLLGLGLMLTFAGYRLFKTLLFLLGLVVGAGAGQFICEIFLWNGWIALAITAAAALAGALIARLMYSAGLFLFGAFIGYAVSQPVIMYFPRAHPLLIIAVLALITGFLMLKLERPVIILFTVLAGAWSTVVAGITLWTGRSAIVWHAAPVPEAIRSVTVLVAWGILIALGLSAQIGRTAKQDPNP